MDWFLSGIYCKIPLDTGLWQHNVIPCYFRTALARMLPRSALEVNGYILVLAVITSSKSLFDINSDMFLSYYKQLFTELEEHGKI